jgi:hypothetical protein
MQKLWLAWRSVNRLHILGAKAEDKTPFWKPKLALRIILKFILWEWESVEDSRACGNDLSNFTKGR